MLPVQEVRTHFSRSESGMSATGTSLTNKSRSSGPGPEDNPVELISASASVQKCYFATEVELKLVFRHASALQ